MSRWGWIGVLVVGLVVGVVAPAGAADVPFVFDGSVDRVADGGAYTYVAGSFTGEFPVTGGGAVVSLTGHAVASPMVDGEVTAAAADGAGGWYISGVFSHVGGRAISGLAHIKRDGSVDPAFAADEPGAGGATKLVVSRHVLYVLGATVQARDRLTGRLLPWDPAPDGRVSDIAVSRGVVYLAGAFTHLGGQDRHGLGAVDAAGKVLGWAPHLSPAGDDTKVALRGTVLYLVGSFTRLGGHARAGMGAVDIRSGRVLRWNPRAFWHGEQVADVAVRATARAVYVSGPFASIAGVKRAGAAALDPATGRVLRWNPGGGRGWGARVLAATRTATYFWGGNSRRQRIPEALDPITGRSLRRQPPLPLSYGPWFVLVPAGSRMYAGGGFSGAGGPLAGVGRLARLRADGSLDPTWRPRVSGCSTAHACITGLVASSRAVYISGAFTQIDGRQRNGLAAIDAVTGRVTGWNPRPDASATPVAATGSAVYLVGEFHHVGGRARSAVAAVDPDTGRVTPWAPRPDGPIQSLVPAGGVVYVAGRFTRIGGQSRPGLAALDGGTGAATTWAPAAAGMSWGPLAVSGDGIFAGTAWPAPRAVVRLDPMSGTVTDTFPYWIDHLVADGDEVFGWSSFEGSAPDLWRYDASAGSFVPWAVALRTYLGSDGGFPAVAMTLSHGSVYIAGGFDAVGDVLTGPLARIDPVTGGAKPMTMRR